MPQEGGDNMHMLSSATWWQSVSMTHFGLKSDHKQQQHAPWRVLSAQCRYVKTEHIEPIVSFYSQRLRSTQCCPSDMMAMMVGDYIFIVELINVTFKPEESLMLYLDQIAQDILCVQYYGFHFSLSNEKSGCFWGFSHPDGNTFWADIEYLQDSSCCWFWIKCGQHMKPQRLKYYFVSALVH